MSSMTMSLQYQQDTFNLVRPEFGQAQEYVQRAFDKVNDYINALRDAAIAFAHEFSSISEELGALTVDGSFAYTENEEYSHEVLTELMDQLEDWIVNGGTGLGATVEDAIWERARDWEALIKERQYEEGRGYTLPSGALAVRLTEALQEQSRADEQINYEIAIEQARLAQNSTQFSMQTTASVLDNLMNYKPADKARLYDAAKYVVQAAVDIFRWQVERGRTLADLLSRALLCKSIPISLQLSNCVLLRTERASRSSKRVSSKKMTSRYCQPVFP